MVESTQVTEEDRAVSAALVRAKRNQREAAEHLCEVALVVAVRRIRAVLPAASRIELFGDYDYDIAGGRVVRLDRVLDAQGAVLYDVDVDEDYILETAIDEVDREILVLLAEVGGEAWMDTRVITLVDD